MKPIRIEIGKDFESFSNCYGVDWFESYDALGEIDCVGNIKVNTIKAIFKHFLTDLRRSQLHLFQPDAFLSVSEFGEVLLEIRSSLSELKNKGKQVVILTYNEFLLNCIGNWIERQAGGLTEKDVELVLIDRDGSERVKRYSPEGVIIDWELDFFGWDSVFKQ